jgi:hypothetical protein
MASRSQKLTVLLTFLLVAYSGKLAGATAIAECVDDAPLDRAAGVRTPASVRLSSGASFIFRVEPARSWRLDKATLLLHVAAGPLPASIDFGSGKPVTIEDKQNGWIAVNVPLALLQKLVAEPRTRLTVRSAKSTAEIHLRESPAFAPYLIIEGSPAMK